MLNHLSLFSGYEGFGLGLRLAGLPIRTVGYLEIRRLLPAGPAGPDGRRSSGPCPNHPRHHRLRFSTNGRTGGHHHCGLPVPTPQRRRRLRAGDKLMRAQPLAGHRRVHWRSGTRITCCWKTCQASWLTDTEESLSVNLPRWGIDAAGAIVSAAKLAHPTSANAGGALQLLADASGHRRRGSPTNEISRRK